MQRKHRGFTLIEILIAMSILAILGTLVVTKFMGRTDDARITKAKSDIKTLESALQVYKLDNYTYPTTDQGLEALVSAPTSEPLPSNWKEGGYIQRLSKDPWNRDYQYLSPGEHSEIDIYSFGADGTDGGEGIAADIGNWNL
jgi:general secretion pathway protein G